MEETKNFTRKLRRPSLSTSACPTITAPTTTTGSASVLVSPLSLSLSAEIFSLIYLLPETRFVYVIRNFDSFLPLDFDMSEKEKHVYKCSIVQLGTLITLCWLNCL